MTAERKLTGWHVLAIFTGAFGIIIAVNLTLAWNAVATFPGLEVANSYVASQTFDARRTAQEALGWSVAVTDDDGTLTLAITDQRGYPVQPAGLSVKVGRRTSARDDHAPTMRFDGVGYSAADPLAPGYWNVWVNARAHDGTPFEQRLDIFVKE
ncbi:FixH family protein [Salipiger sp.]|uniref:FixH family protein n=1 Tax=Salipiger sp. TaxID=2078585 RepID=UPI003A981021